MALAGLSLGDFERLTPDELESVFRAWSEERERRRRESWEQLRLGSWLTIRPHCKDLPGPEEVLPFEWDRKMTTPLADKETARREVSELLARVRQ